MGNLRQVLVLLLLSPLINSLVPPSNPPRPTRTISALFGSSTKPAAQVSPPVQPEASPARPLVYQVKYFERPSNNIPIDQTYGVIDKSGVVPVEPPPQQQFFSQPTYPTIPPRYIYYNPLIPSPQQESYYPPTPQTYYTIGQIGNSQVLVPCSVGPNGYPVPNLPQPIEQFEQPYTNVVLNVDKPTPTVPIPAIRNVYSEMKAPQVPRVPTVNAVPPQVPLVREQVVQAAAEMSGAVPGSGVVGAGINSAPFGYYYYYYIPPPPPQQQQQQIPFDYRFQQQPFRYTPNIQYVVQPTVSASNSVQQQQRVSPPQPPQQPQTVQKVAMQTNKPV